ncbi:MAG TPA: membrane protein insertase YidC [Allosphingosinicella sp.]
MNQQRNLMLAIVLSALVLFGWSFFAQKWLPTANPPATKTVNGKQVPLPKPNASPSATPAAAVVRDRNAVIGETPRIAIDTPRLHGSINLKGAQIDDLVLTQHRESIAKDSPPIRLLSPAGGPDAYFARIGWTGEGVAVPDANTVWTASGTRLTPSTPVTLTWTNPTGQRFDVRISIDDGYLFSVDQTIANGSASAVAVRPYGLVSRAGASKDVGSYTMHVGPMGVFNGTANYSWKYSDLQSKGPQTFQTSGGWAGFTDKYWLTAMIPDQKSSVEAALRPGPSGSFQADYAGAPTVVQAGKALTYTSHLFAGAKEVRLLDRYSEALGTPLERAIDWGWFRWFMKPIFSLLLWLYEHIGNFGVAIICLTLIVRTIMFPIAQKQFRSMAAMRVLQPKMKVLQDRHKEDKGRLQQEMLKLYQEEKVNPVAGCLPILIQIPIFYALYKTLLVSVEMRHKPFALWIKDLSAPDPMSPVNLFGFLHFTPPGYLAIGVLPILFGVTMFLQTRLNPPPADPVQKQMMSIMPWFMMFIFAPFAAGLQLYYVCNNLFGLAQQSWLNRRYGVGRDSDTIEAKVITR